MCLASSYETHKAFLNLDNHIVAISSADLEVLASRIQNFYSGKDELLYSMYVDTPWISNITSSTSSYLYSGLDNVYYYQKFNVYHNNIRQDSLVKYDRHYLCGDPSLSATYQMKLTLNYTNANKQSAMFVIILIVVVIILLFVFSYSFSTAVNDLVVKVRFFRYISVEAICSVIH